MNYSDVPINLYPAATADSIVLCTKLSFAEERSLNVPTRKNNKKENLNNSFPLTVLSISMLSSSLDFEGERGFHSQCQIKDCNCGAGMDIYHMSLP